MLMRCSFRCQGDLVSDDFVKVYNSRAKEKQPTVVTVGVKELSDRREAIHDIHTTVPAVPLE